MKRIYHSIFIFSYLMISTSISISAPVFGSVPKSIKKYNLKYKMKKGSSFIVTSTRKDHYTREIMGNEIVVNQLDFNKYQFTVKTSKRKGLHLEMKYLGKEHSSEESNTIPADFTGCQGIPTSLFLSRIGDLSNFTGFDKLPVVEIRDRQVSMNKDSYINELMDIFPLLPNRRVGPGESWNHQKHYSEKIGEDSLLVGIDITYTLIEESECEGLPCLIIDSAFTLELIGQVNVEGINLTVQLEGEGKERIHFIPKRGLFHSIEGSSTLVGSADNQEMGLTIPMLHEYTFEIRADLE